MPIDISKTWLFRIIPLQILAHNLQHGLHCKNAGVVDPNYIAIGSQEVISRRDNVMVKCYTDTVVNDYVPFYFSVRTPMLYNIHTGRGVPAFPQEGIVYLCFKLAGLATAGFQWCFTDGNAAAAITRFFNNLDDLEQLDWHSIGTTDFRDQNADGDEDRVRKKHSEFLVKDYVPMEHLAVIVVKSQAMKERVEAILIECNIEIPVHINPRNKFYF